jgi:RNA polymerase sigma-70 factor (ECF subfamily)
VEPPPREELERVRDRDPEALGRFFDRYFDRIYGLAHRMLGDPNAAEDVSQEVFLKVHRAVDRLDVDRDPMPWLAAITANACRELWRGKHHKAAGRSVPLDDLADWERRHPVSGDSPERDLLSAERAAVVQGAIRELPEKLREVLVLHDWEGLSHQEIAERLDASYAAIRKRYSRALAALAKRLGSKP